MARPIPNQPEPDEYDADESESPPEPRGRPVRPLSRPARLQVQPQPEPISAEAQDDVEADWSTDVRPAPGRFAPASRRDEEAGEEDEAVEEAPAGEDELLEARSPAPRSAGRAPRKGNAQRSRIGSVLFLAGLAIFAAALSAAVVLVLF